MSTKKTSARTAVTRVLIFSLALGLIAVITASAAPGGSFAFLDSVKEFLGIQRAEVSVLKEQPKAPQLAQVNEAMSEPLVAPMGPLAGVTYYSQGSVTPSTLSNWNTNRLGGGSSPANFTGGDIFVIQGTGNGGTSPHSMSTTATWTVSGSGATIQIENGGSLTANNIVAVPNFQVDNGGNYIHNAASGTSNGTATDVPGSTSRTFGASSNVEFQQWAGGGTGPVGLPTVSWGNLKINVGTLAGSWGQGGALTTVVGNLTIQSTGGTTREFRLNANSPATSTLNLTGDLIISGGIFNVTSGTAVETLNVGGNFNQTGGTFTGTGSGPHSVNFTGGASSVSFTQSAGTFTNTTINFSVGASKTVNLSSNFPVATSRTLTVNGTVNSSTNAVTGTGAFTLAATGTLGLGSTAGLSTTASTGNIQVTGTRTYTSGATFVYNGSAAQVTGNGIPASVSNLTVNNSTGVTLSAATSVSNVFTLTSGKLTTDSTNLLTVTNTATGGISGGSSTAYVNGPLARSLPGSLSGSNTYSFPVGKGGYNPFELINPATGAAPTVRAEVFDANSGGTGSGITLRTDRYWSSSVTTGAVSSSLVKLTDSSLGATNRVGYSTTQSGTYSSKGGSVSGSTIQSTDSTLTFPAFFVIGSIPITYTITASSGANGTVTPAGATTVNSGGGQAYTIAPDTGYHIVDVLVNGGSVGAVGSYSFTNVTSNQTISATFAINTYNITSSAGANGSISPNGVTAVNHGANQAYTITPDTGHHVADVLVDGGSVGAVTNYTFNNVTATHTISASFAINTYAITASAGTGGTIAPNGVTNVNYNGSQAYTITPNAGYAIADVLVDGGSVGAVGAYTFLNVTATHTISASFALNNATFDDVATLPAGSYNNIDFDSGAYVTLTGDVDIQGCVTINSGATVLMGTFVFSGPGCFTLDAGGSLGTGNAAGITASGATGSIQVAGARSYSSSASYFYNGATNQAVGNGLPATVFNLTITNTGTDSPVANKVTGNSGQIVTGMLAVEDGVYESHSDYNDVTIGSGATLTLTGPTTVSGNWVNNGGTLNGNFPVTFDGITGQSISGNTTFYGLTKSITTPAQTFFFAAGSTTTVTNALTLTGTAGNLLSLRSDAPASQWLINATGTRSVDYVDVQDSNATGSGSAINATHSADSGNNTNWTFIDVVNYTIDVTQTANGTISPDDTVVTGGANQTFYITPAVGYDIVSLTVDGAPVAVAGSYTFTSVSANHTITATYASATCRTISIAALTSNTGVAVTVPVNTTSVTGGNVISAQFKVTYNPAVITPVAGGPSAVVTAGTVLPGGTSITANTATAGVIEVSLSGTTPFTGTGTLVDLHFDVIGAPATSTALDLSNITEPGPDLFYNGGTVCANVSDGSLTVTATGSTTVVTTSPVGTSVYGNNVTFTATITPATTGGTVQFQVDGNNVGTPQPVTAGVATYSTTILQVSGSAHTITGNYSGFSPYSASSGSTTITITARPITVTAATDSKGYDGSTSSAGIPTVTAGTLENGDVGVFTQTFDNRNVGTGKTLTPAGTVTDGNSGNNYAITFVPVTTGTITARAITVTAATDTKGYDGTTSSVGIPTVTSGSIVSPDAGSFSQTFANRNVGTGKTINAAGSVNDLNGGANYAITFVANTTGAITARAITVTATTDTKGYDGNTSSAAVPTITSGSLGTGDSAVFSQVFDTRNVGTGKTLTPSGTITDGNAGLNYVVTYTPVATGEITARAITVTAATDTKGYDGTTTSTGVPTITSGSLISPDSATLSQTFDTKNVGTGKTLTALAVITDGNGGANYAVTYVADTTGVITARAITVTASTDSREYNGTTSSAPTPVIGPGTIAVGDTAGFSQSFATKHVGTGKTINPAGSVSDSFGGLNYAVTFVANTTGVITAKAITVTAVTDTREYNGTNSSSGSPNISPALVGGDTSGFTQSFDNRNVGTGKTLTAAGAAVDGNSGLNYAVTFVADTTGVITAKSITVTAVTETKGYDGTTDSSGTPNISPALVGGDTSGFTQTFDNKNVGTGKTLTAAGVVNDSFGGANYAVTFVSVSTGVITARAITVTAATDSRVYNGTTSSAGTPTITSGSLAVGDSAVFSQTFDTRNVGTGKTLTPTGTITDGNGGANYAVTYTAVSTGTITAKPITVTAVTETREYNGTTSSSVSPNILPALVGGDTSGFTQSFDTRNVGTGKTLTATGVALDGNSGANYAVTFVAVSTGVITAKAITVTAVTDTKIYDGTTSSSISPNISPALVGGDTSGFTQTFDTENVGTGKTLTAAGVALDGFGGANYAVTFVSVATGEITARAISVTAATDTKIYDGTTSSVGVPTITSGSLASGDSAVFSQTFDTRHVGTGKTLTPTGTVSDGFGGANYAVTYASVTTGVITTKAATWTTNPASKTFGDADPVPLTTGSGDFLAIDGVTATYSRVAGEVASLPTYHITATLSATGSLSNYSITNNGAEFTINARTLSGTVTYENATPGTVAIKQTTITSTGSAPLPAPVQTDLNGNYSLTGFGTTSYTITPTKAPYATNQFNGIFANDASLIAQHVVHLITLNAAQQKAADVSGIGAITSFDASLVAQYIVGIPNGLNRTGNWTFTPASTSLIVTPGSVRDFTGVLMGDVSGDWNPAGARPAQVVGKDAVSSVRAVVSNVTAAPGTAFTVPFRIENLEGAGVKAYQFDIEYNPAVVSPASIAATVNGTISEGLAVVSNAPMPGLLKVVVFGAFPVNGDGVYVNLQFSAIGGTGSSSPLSIREFRLDEGETPVFTIDGSLTVASATNENSIQGRLLTPFGSGVSNATVILTGTTIGTRVHVVTGGMGYFEFGGLVMGETYTVSVRSKRFTFSPRTVSVTQNVTNLDMIAEQ